LAGKIEVYVRYEERAIPDEYVHPVIDGAAGMYPGRMDPLHWRVQRSISESDRQALNCVKEFAGSKGLTVEVCDTNTFAGKMKAWVKGVKTTPTVIIGNSRIQGNLTPEELRNKLQSCTTR
jgi:glutaredoxin